MYSGGDFICFLFSHNFPNDASPFCSFLSSSPLIAVEVPLKITTMFFKPKYIWSPQNKLNDCSTRAPPVWNYRTYHVAKKVPPCVLSNVWGDGLYLHYCNNWDDYTPPFSVWVGLYFGASKVDLPTHIGGFLSTAITRVMSYSKLLSIPPPS